MVDSSLIPIPVILLDFRLPICSQRGAGAHGGSGTAEFEHDEPDEQEQAEMKRSLGIYTEQLPEYKYLADEVLEGYGVG